MDSNKITRAINVTLDERAVKDLCHSNALRISAIEPLMAGGTHVVLVTIEDADQARHLMKKSLITGKVSRTPFMRSSTR